MYGIINSIAVNSTWLAFIVEYISVLSSAIQWRIQSFLKGSSFQHILNIVISLQILLNFN